MNLQYASDLHLEFDENRDWLDQHPIRPEADILILAGDIIPLKSLGHPLYERYWDLWADQFERVYWIPGNHEFFGGSLDGYEGTFREEIRPNIWLLNNHVIEDGGARLLLSTLWSPISPSREIFIQLRMNDYRVIQYQGQLLTPSAVSTLYANNFAWLESALVEKSILPTVVVTHHVPTYHHFPAVFQDSLINEAFTVELAPFIKSHDIHSWIYGHHHVNTPIFTLNNTNICTNQLGYVAHQEHKAFLSTALIT